jgi:hypothetical protein
MNPLDGPCRIEVAAAYLGLSVPSTRRLANAGKIQWVDLGVDAAILWGPSLRSFAEKRGRHRPSAGQRAGARTGQETRQAAQGREDGRVFR